MGIVAPTIIIGNLNVLLKFKSVPEDKYFSVENVSTSATPVITSPLPRKEFEHHLR